MTPIYAKWVSPREVSVFDGKLLRMGDTVYVHPTPGTLKAAGYLPLLDGVIRPGGTRVVYSTDGEAIYRNTVEEEA